MYTTDIYLFIGVVDILLTIYAVLAKGTDYYKELIALFIAGILSVYLGVAATTGTVILSDSNGYLNDAGLMWVGIIIAATQGFFLLMEFLEERQARKEEKMQL